MGEKAKPKTIKAKPTLTMTITVSEPRMKKASLSL